jgi:predicted nucleic acid-binding protein
LALAGTLKGKTVFIDTAPLIYFIEKHPAYLNVLKPVFTSINAGRIKGLTSTITLLEVLVHPLRMGNEKLARLYREILLDSQGMISYEITHAITEKAAHLRAKYSFKTPDAIQLAACSVHQADFFLTNDSDLKKAEGITVLVLDDYVK